MRDFFETTNKNFDSVFSSTALRAVETIEIIKPAIKDTEIMYKKDLYTFDDHMMLEFISKITDEISSVLIVGHNPAIQETVLRLSDTDQNSKVSYCRFLYSYVHNRKLGTRRRYDVQDSRIHLPKGTIE